MLTVCCLRANETGVCGKLENVGLLLPYWHKLTLNVPWGAHWFGGLARVDTVDVAVAAAAADELLPLTLDGQ